MPVSLLRPGSAMLWVLFPMTDPMDEIKAKAQAEFELFDAERQRLIQAHRQARAPKARLKTLAAIVRQHGEFMSRNLFTCGWVAQTVLNFADAIDIIADEEL
jgi:hypothetical protein